MASFTREDYEWCISFARKVYALDAGSYIDIEAEKLFRKCELVIGQQSIPLTDEEKYNPHDRNP